MRAPPNRTTPDVITTLQPHEVFVFGSNEAGNHGRGAAADAVKWGAHRSVPAGYSRQTYAIPTKPKNVRLRLDVSRIGNYVDDFVAFAEKHPALRFLVTPIGCGLAGYKPEDIAPLFRDSIDLDNVSLPLSFWDLYCSTCHSVIEFGYCTCDEE